MFATEGATRLKFVRKSRSRECERGKHDCGSGKHDRETTRQAVATQGHELENTIDLRGELGRLNQNVAAEKARPERSTGKGDLRLEMQ